MTVWFSKENIAPKKDIKKIPLWIKSSNDEKEAVKEDVKLDVMLFQKE